jgi:hypothetical protein
MGDDVDVLLDHGAVGRVRTALVSGDDCGSQLPPVDTTPLRKRSSQPSAGRGPVNRDRDSGFAAMCAQYGPTSEVWDWSFWNQ